MIPEWFTYLSWFGLTLGIVSSLIIVVDLLGSHGQHMKVMNLVWPVAALFGSVVTLVGYFRYGRLATEERFETAELAGREPPSKTETPFRVMVAKAASHCGSGCTIGDIMAEFLVLAFPVVATWFGWKSLFPESEVGKVYSTWVVDFLFAFVLGIVFQYFTIVPMRKLSPGKGLKAALKADTLSLTAWQLGMYGFMGFINLYVARTIWHHSMKPDSPEFWFSMQLAMICGFMTSYPVNWWLLRKGIKEKM